MSKRGRDDLSKRARWEIYVTPMERACIEAGAKARRLPIGAAAAKAMGSVQHVERADWRENVRLLVAIDRRIGELLVEVRKRADPLDVLAVTAALVSLDRAVRQQVMPWTLLDNDSDEPLPDNDEGEAAP